MHFFLARTILWAGIIVMSKAGNVSTYIEFIYWLREADHK